MVGSENQVRHLYVANAYVASNAALKKVGDITIGKVGDDLQKDVYFKVQGPDTVLKSDYIPVKNISSVKVTKAADMAVKLKKVQVALDTDVNSGNLIVGQDYILRINLRQFYGMSDQDQYFKDAAVHVTKGMTATTFYAAMAKALNLSFSREVGATKDSNPYLTFSSSASGVVIEEKEQSWHLGTEAQERVYFDVVPTTVYDGVDDLIWGKVTDQTDKNTNVVGNGKKIADLEYFLLGERGDQYRKIGFPNDIETRGMVDPSKTYDVIDIHYAFTDTGVNSYRTEKDLTIVVPTAVKSTGTDPDYTVINAIITAFNTATGLSITSL